MSEQCEFPLAEVGWVERECCLPACLCFSCSLLHQAPCFATADCKRKKRQKERVWDLRYNTVRKILIRRVDSIWVHSALLSLHVILYKGKVYVWVTILLPYYYHPSNKFITRVGYCSIVCKTTWQLCFGTNNKSFFFLMTFWIIWSRNKQVRQQIWPEMWCLLLVFDSFQYSVLWAHFRNFYRCLGIPEVKVPFNPVQKIRLR